MANAAIKRALLSVTNKDGICEFATRLVHDFGVEILSTGGTARVLEAAGIAVTHVEDYTASPEMMGGRVKTLHPRIHGGLLCRRDNEHDLQDARENNIPMIDLVCVNLYAFEKTIETPGCTLEDAVEHIDIGGPSMLRSAAKNFAAVTTVCDPADYERVLAEMHAHAGHTTLALRSELARKVFATTAHYDAAITTYLTSAANEQAAREADGVDATMPNEAPSSQPFPEQFMCTYTKQMDLRYGEIPISVRRFMGRLRQTRTVLPRLRSYRAKSCRTTTCLTPMLHGAPCVSLPILQLLS